MGAQINHYKLSLNSRSSKGGRHPIILPAYANISAVIYNGVSQMVQQTKKAEHITVTLPINPAQNNHYTIEWSEHKNLAALAWQPSQINLNAPSANHVVNIKFNTDKRWLLWLDGPVMGPAILFWGTLLVLMGLAIILGLCHQWTTLGVSQWILLLLGLSQVSVESLFIIVAWFVLFNLRKQFAGSLMARPYVFNSMQIGLGLLTLIALSTLLYSMHHGLLGAPEMKIIGNQSTHYILKWYQDRVPETLAEISLISVPLYVYRILMVVWALWLANALISWLKQQWQAFSREAIWVTAVKKSVADSEVKEPKL